MSSEFGAVKKSEPRDKKTDVRLYGQKRATEIHVQSLKRLTSVLFTLPSPRMP